MDTEFVERWVSHAEDGAAGGGPHSLANGRLNGNRCDSWPAAPRHSWYTPIKGVCDLLAALILLLVLAPVIALAALLVKMTSRGPAFYRQTRLGKHGRPFMLIKLRTMVHDAEARTGPIWSSGKNDPRVTPLGRFLRATHIDEFPQLINVLCGHMSLVGPRPERPEFIQRLEWNLPHYTHRLNVRPGITGLAQLKLPPDSDLESVRRKLIYDLYYVERANPWLDVRIFWCTGWHLMHTLTTLLRRSVALPTPEPIAEFHPHTRMSPHEPATLSKAH